MSSPVPIPQFDPIKYKGTTCEQWNNAAQAWHDWTPCLQQWLGPATQIMLDMAGVQPGSRVLDIAAGAGDQTLETARRVGPQGFVLATDLSPTILQFADANAKRHGLDNVATHVMDGEHVDVEPASFDAVISRVGLIYFPDQQAALAGMKHALRPGGHFAAIVYTTADRNAFFSIPVSIVRRRANLPPPAPGQPGPFSLGSPGVLRDALQRAGFRDVEEEVVPAPLRMKSAAECLRFEKESFGALHTMLASLSDAEKNAAWQEIEDELRRFEGANGFVGPCELLVVSGAR